MWISCGDILFFCCVRWVCRLLMVRGVLVVGVPRSRKRLNCCASYWGLCSGVAFRGIEIPLPVWVVVVGVIWEEGEDGVLVLRSGI